MAIELQDPRDIQLGGSTTELLKQVSTANEALLEHRPFSDTLGERLRVALLPDRVTASLNMEGIVATRRQTLAVMDAMRISESPGRGEQEILNALRGDEFVQDCVDKGLSLDARVIRHLNGLVVDQIQPDAGEFRAGQVELPGAPFAPPPPSDVPGLIEYLASLYPLGESVHPIVHAAWVHAQFTLVHPFSDGNGRVGRLLQDYTLLRRGLLPVGIPPSQRDDYYGALELGDQGKWDQMVELLADLELRMIAKARAIASEPERRTAWIERLSSAAAAKASNTRHKKYLVWRQRVQQLADSFEQAASELDSASYVVGASYRGFGVVDFPSWEDICKYGAIGRSWLFSLILFAEGQPFYKTICYAKRHVSGAWDPFPPERDLVGLFFTGEDPTADERSDFNHYSDPHIRLREILWVDDGLVVLKEEPGDEGWTVGDESTTEAIVESFFLDAFSRKAGLAF